jgi:hypothetical protein
MICMTRESGAGRIIVDNGRFCNVSGRRGKSTRRRKKVNVTLRTPAKNCFNLMLLCCRFSAIRTEKAVPAF